MDLAYLAPIVAVAIFLIGLIVGRRTAPKRFLRAGMSLTGSHKEQQQ